MKRRSKVSGQRLKAQRPNASKLKDRAAANATRGSSSAARPEGQIVRLTRELDEAREQQAATSEVLRALSQSEFQLKSVLQSVAESAARLCRSDGAVIFQLQDGVYRFAAGYSLLPEFLEIERRALISPGPGTLIGRAAMTRKVARIDDALTDPLYEKKEDAKVEGNRSMIGVPLMRGGEPVVVIGMDVAGSIHLESVRLSWQSHSPLKRSSPSRTRGCSTNCVSAPPTSPNAQRTSRKR